MVSAEVQIEHPGDLPGLQSDGVLELSMVFTTGSLLFWYHLENNFCILLAFPCNIPAI